MSCGVKRALQKKKKSYDGSNFDHKNSSIKLTTIMLLETSILFTLQEIEQHIEGI